MGRGSATRAWRWWSARNCFRDCERWLSASAPEADLACRASRAGYPRGDDPAHGARPPCGRSMLCTWGRCLSSPPPAPDRRSVRHRKSARDSPWSSPVGSDCTFRMDSSAIRQPTIGASAPIESVADVPSLFLHGRMTLLEEHLVRKALAALREIAEECGDTPASKTLSLRFILMFT